MCTVTFIPSGDKIYITSNRDEKSWRRQALPPRFYIHNQVQLLYPRDEDAGGSWIAVNENGNAAVLLNGAFVKHTPSSSYRKSRGLIFLDIIKSYKPLKYFSAIDLTSIEPFTIIIVEATNLFECRWDGHKKYCRQRETAEAHIWSSATLYNKQVRGKREQRFAAWLIEHKEPEQDNILSFHRFSGDGNKETDLLMSRGGEIYTVSITSVELNNANAIMQYHDLHNKETHFAKMQLQPAATLYYAYDA